MNGYKKIMYVVLALILCACQTSTDKDIVISIQPPQIYEVPVLEKTSVVMKEKETIDLKVLNGGLRSIQWSSDNSKIALVDANGKVTANQKGTTMIKAQVNKLTLMCQVTVKSAVVDVETISLNKTSITLTEGQKYTLKATVFPKDATDKSLSYTSRNNGIVSVDNKGVITAKSAGKTIVDVKSKNDKKAQCTIVVEKKKESTNQPAPVEPVVPSTPQEKPVEDEPLVTTLKAANKYSKIMIVSANNTSTRNGQFEYYKKVDDKWNLVMSTSAQLGKNGINKTKEGDKKTPSGLFTFTKLMGIASNPGTNWSYHQIDENDYWCGETYYNQFIDEDIQEHNCSKKDDEHLMDFIKPYQYVAVLNYNSGNVAGKGSGIFLHCLTSTGHTFGCIGISKSYMQTIMRDIDSNTCIIIDTKSRIKNY